MSAQAESGDSMQSAPDDMAPGNSPPTEDGNGDLQPSLVDDYGSSESNEQSRPATAEMPVADLINPVCFSPEQDVDAEQSTSAGMHNQNQQTEGQVHITASHMGLSGMYDASKDPFFDISIGNLDGVVVEALPPPTLTMGPGDQTLSEAELLGALRLAAQDLTDQVTSDVSVSRVNNVQMEDEQDRVAERLLNEAIQEEQTHNHAIYNQTLERVWSRPDSPGKRSGRLADNELRETAEKIRQQTLREEREYLEGQHRRQEQLVVNGEVSQTSDEPAAHADSSNGHDHSRSISRAQLAIDESAATGTEAEVAATDYGPEDQPFMAQIIEEQVRLCEVNMRQLSRHELLLWTGCDDPPVCRPKSEKDKQQQAGPTPPVNVEPERNRSCFNCAVALREKDGKSAYCSERCIHAQVAKARQMLRDSAEHVVVVERRTGRVIGAPTAPTLAQLHHWLLKRPSFTPLLPTQPTKNNKHSSLASSPAAGNHGAVSRTGEQRPSELVRTNVKKAIKQVLAERIKRGDAASDVNVSPAELRNLSQQIEEAVYAQTSQVVKYKKWFRVFFEQLKHSSNRAFFRRVLAAELTPSQLAGLQVEQLSELQAQSQDPSVHGNEYKAPPAHAPVTKPVKKMNFVMKSNKAVKKDTVNAKKKADEKSGPADTTNEHGRHLFDKYCRVCNGQISADEHAAELARKKKAEQPVTATVTVQMENAVVESELPVPLEDSEQPGMSVEGSPNTNSAHAGVVVPEKTRPQATVPPTPRYVQPDSVNPDRHDRDRDRHRAVHVWTGQVIMPSYYKFESRMLAVSGRAARHLRDELPARLEVVGRINPQVVWKYVSNALSAVPRTQEIIVLRIERPDTTPHCMKYDAFYENMRSKNRFSVVGRMHNKIVKDFYLLPLDSPDKLHPSLLPLDGPGFPPTSSGRPAHHILACVVVRACAEKGAVLNEQEPRMMHTPDAWSQLVGAGATNESLPPAHSMPMTTHSSTKRTAHTGSDYVHAEDAPPRSPSPDDTAYDQGGFDEDDDAPVHSNTQQYSLTPPDQHWQQTASPTQVVADSEHVSRMHRVVYGTRQAAQLTSPKQPIIPAPPAQPTLASLLAPPPPPPPPAPPAPPAITLMPDLQIMIDKIRTAPDIEVLVAEAQEFMDEKPLSTAESGVLLDALHERLEEEKRRKLQLQTQGPEPVLPPAPAPPSYEQGAADMDMDTDLDHSQSYDHPDAHAQRQPPFEHQAHGHRPYEHDDQHTRTDRHYAHGQSHDDQQYRDRDRDWEHERHYNRHSQQHDRYDDYAADTHRDYAHHGNGGRHAEQYDHADEYSHNERHSYGHGHNARSHESYDDDEYYAHNERGDGHEHFAPEPQTPGPSVQSNDRPGLSDVLLNFMNVAEQEGEIVTDCPLMPAPSRVERAKEHNSQYTNKLNEDNDYNYKMDRDRSRGNGRHRDYDRPRPPNYDHYGDEYEPPSKRVYRPAPPPHEGWPQPHRGMRPTPSFMPRNAPRPHMDFGPRWRPDMPPRMMRPPHPLSSTNRDPRLYRGRGPPPPFF